MDESNVNLFCRRTRGRARIGERAVTRMPNSKGPNVHIIGAISSMGPELIECKRGSFNWESANAYIQRLVQAVVERGVPRRDIIIICDNAPVHSRFEVIAHELGIGILRLGPYSPMLNPIENIWSVVKAAIKRMNRVPFVDGPGIMEQRLQYVENSIRVALEEITPYLCTSAINHSVRHHRRALNLENMEVGR